MLIFPINKLLRDAAAIKRIFVTEFSSVRSICRGLCATCSWSSDPHTKCIFSKSTLIQATVYKHLIKADKKWGEMARKICLDNVEVKLGELEAELFVIKAINDNLWRPYNELVEFRYPHNCSYTGKSASWFRSQRNRFLEVSWNYPDPAQLDFGSISRMQRAEGDIQDYCKLYLRGSTCEAFSTQEQEEQAKCRMQNRVQIVTLTGYTDRFMFLAVSPEGKTNANGAGDETFRFWNVFQSMKAQALRSVENINPG
ncbi:hypothetical protein IGI04_036247 [Brassica rapa subsp. trilocularis]|uniref:Uncharacterized protein n=1 Tax=Brassica rapa subsp. trilocularis TaxID=1813537 RepID=A0ABQ7LEW8_BRACM|nr:hypothetical protein IGI04_036247 [Brassica rapa subsp. trilocularis]